MARQVQISSKDIQRAQQLRDQAITIADYRKAISLILVAELSLAEVAGNKLAIRQLTNWPWISAILKT